MFDIWKANLRNPKRITRASWWSGLARKERAKMGTSAEHASPALFALSQPPFHSTDQLQTAGTARRPTLAHRPNDTKAA